MQIVLDHVDAQLTHYPPFYEVITHPRDYQHSMHYDHHESTSDRSALEPFKGHASNMPV